MKIISKFSDYYDSVGKQFQGIPGQRIWMRTETEVDDESLKRQFSTELGLTRSTQGSFQQISRKEKITYEFNILGFAGQIIPFVKISQQQYPSSECSQIIESIHYTLDEVKQRLVKPPPWFSHSGFSDLFNKQHCQLSWTLWNALQTPLVLLKVLTYKILSDKCNFTVVKNPNLNLLEFYRIKDPYTCYQELDQFLNKLTSPVESHPEIPDKFRLIEHGFDQKISFRKRKPSTPPTKK